MRSFMACTPCQILFGYSNQSARDGQGMRHTRKNRNIDRVLLGHLKERDHLEDARITLKWIFNMLIECGLD
jgi:hypothetical protein